MAQYGFFFDQSRCSGCRACAVACKSWHGLPAGPLKYLKIFEYEKGIFPDIRIHFQWVPCYHCQKPECIVICPQEAIYKEKKFGAVLIDSNKCNGCRLCYDSCPYGAPVFESDEIGVNVRKCNMCVDRLEVGLKPVCILACPNRALDFGALNELIARYGDIRDLKDMPDSQTTLPSVLFKSHIKKSRLIPYNTQRALKLLMRRDCLPPVFKSLSDVTEISEGTIGRNDLVLKHKSADDLMRQTRSDEG